MRLVKQVDGHEHGRFARVLRDSDWNEFRVEFYKGGRHEVQADYHTDDKEDALSTAAFVVKPCAH